MLPTQEGAKVTKAEYEAKMRQIAEEYAQATFATSAIIEGPAVHFLKNRTKKAKIPGSRGSYISQCIMFYEQNKRSNPWGSIATLERLELKVSRISKAREALQNLVYKLQESGK